MTRPISRLALRVSAIALSANLLIPLIATSQIDAQGAPAFQSFFFGVCSTATGSLGVRCSQTPGGVGDISADSEDSLNPTHLLAVNNAALAQAKAAAQATEEIVEERREESPLLGEGWGVYGQVAAEFFDRDETSRERGFDGHSTALQIGVDRSISDTTIIGGLLTFERTDSEFDADDPGVAFFPPSDDGDSDVETWSFTLYVSSYLAESVFLDASVAYGFSDYDFVRRGVFQETNRVVPQTNVSARADTEGNQLALSTTLGFDAGVSGWTLSPYLRLSFLNSEVDGYREQDASGLQMQLDDESQSSFTSVIGVRGSRAFSTSFGVIVPQIRLEYEHEFLRDAETIATRYVLDPAGTTLRIRGDDPDRDVLNAAIGVALVLPNGWIPFADYEALIGHSFEDRHRLLVGVRKEF